MPALTAAREEMRISDFLYLSGVHARRLMLEAEKGGKTGNGNETTAPDAKEGEGEDEGTQKAQLDRAKAKISDLEGKLQASEGLQTKIDDLTGQLSAANDAKAQAEKAKAEAEEKVKALEGEKGTLSAKVKELEGQVGQTADKAREQLSGAGLNQGQKKQTPAESEANAGDPIALWESYAKADATTKAAMRAQHGAKLEAAAAAYDRAQAGN
ncbi:hypothetical protein ACXR0O_19145 [Verrucomicrobiota bacterium sgz303538]